MHELAIRSLLDIKNLCLDTIRVDDTAITNLSTTKQAYLVSIEAAQVEKLLAASPYYVKHVIPAGTYSGITTDTTTVAVAAVVLVRDDVPEDVVYAMTAELFGNLKALEASHAKFAEMSIEFGASVTSVLTSSKTSFRILCISSLITLFRL